MKNLKIIALTPVMFTFFSMGFVDMVGIATNHVKIDFGLTDSVSNLFPSMVFLWFLIFSVPTGLLMNKIGRRKTVVLSLTVTFLAMLAPLLDYNMPVMLLSFALLGIGNTLMQVSLNPLVTNIVSGNQLASSLTLGQFFKAIASFTAPLIAGWAAIQFGNWRLLYPVFAVVSLIPILWLSLTSIEEIPTQKSTSTIGKCFALLGNSAILLLFVGILVHVGIDVGVNLTAPKILMERTGIDLIDAGYIISIYFLSRTIGCFSGAFMLSKISSRKIFLASVAVLILGIIGLFFTRELIPVYVSVALLGIGNSNIFPMIFSQAMQVLPERNNEVSGLMIMGVSGGAVFPIFMGFASDALNTQNGAVVIIAFCIAYLIFLSSKFK